jgi:hypothetical protein
VENCIAVVTDWLASNFLSMNENKTEFLIVGTETMLKRCSVNEISVGGQNISLADSICLLGVIIDKSLKMDQFISRTCRSAYAHLRTLGRLRGCLSTSALTLLIHAFVISRLDYCIILLSGVPASTTHRLQRVLNSAMRVIYGLKRNDHLSAIKDELQWLPVTKRIVYRIAVLTFKAMHGAAPGYITDLLQDYVPTRQLRSSAQRLLYVPPMSTSAGDRALRVVAPKLWNSLPDDIRQCKNVDTFMDKVYKHLLCDCCVVSECVSLCALNCWKGGIPGSSISFKVVLYYIPV